MQALHIKKCFLLVAFFTLMQTAFAQVPVISSFEPSSGPVGSVVTIKGSNFGATAASNIVHFGGVEAVVTTATANTITVLVPGGSTYEPIAVTTNNTTAYSKKPFDVTFPDGNTSFSPTSFSPYTDLKLGSTTAQYPRKTLLTDFDRDGKPDLILNEFASNAIYICKNVKQGTDAPFKAPATLKLTTDAGAKDFVNVDFDGDGLIDVAVLTFTANTINIFKNTSTGNNLSFAPKTNVPTVASPTFITSSDIDGDGRPDIVVTGLASNAISVYKNISDNTGIKFAAKIDYTSYQPTATVMADMNGDGLPDMVYTLPGQSSIAIRKNTSAGGNIAFANAVTLAFNAGYSLSVADVDNDGKPDLLLGSTYGSLIIYLNTTPNSGPLSFAAGVSVLDNTLYVLGVTMNDLDGDGLADMAVRYKDLAVNGSASQIPVLRNLSTPGIIKFSYTALYSLYSPQSVCSADIDGDGKPDLVAGTDQNGLAVYILSKVVEPVLTGYKTTDGVNVTINGTNLLKTSALSLNGNAITSYTINSATSISAVFPANTEGVISVTTPYGVATLSGFTNIPVPVIRSFSPLSGSVGATVTITGSNFNTSPAANQVFFGSLKATVTAASPTSLTVTVPYGSLNSPISVANNRVTGYSAIAFTTTFPGGAGKFASGSFAAKQDVGVGYVHGDVVAAADFDGDGYLDAAFPENSLDEDSPIYVFKNTGNKQTPFLGGQVLTLTGGGDISDITTADFDGDQKPDIAAIDEYFGNISVFQNTSSGGKLSFTKKSSFANNYNVTNLYTGDLDGDGKSDIITIGGNNDGLVSVLKNTTSNGVISFARKLNFGISSSTLSIVMTDFDGDNKTDIVITTTGAVKILRNTSVNGAISFAPLQTINLTGTVPGITSADFDGDGKPDLAVMTGANAFSVLRNTSIAGTVSFGSPLKVLLPATTFAAYIAANDLDGDGKPDIVVSNGNKKSSVSVFKNLSNGSTLQFDTGVDYTTGLISQGVTSGDFNNDGKPDIAVATDQANSFSLLTNKSNEPALYTYKIISGDAIKNVVITGFNLTGATALTIAGETITSFTVVSDEVINAISSLKTTGTITVTTPLGTATLTGFSPPPAITSYTVAATTPYPTVTINGTFLTGATAVKFGGVAAKSFTVNSAFKITAVASSVTLGEIEVTTPSGTVKFAYNAAVPTITSFTPATASTGQTITISGTNLTGATAVSLGGLAVTSFTINSATSITATVGAGASGDVAVTTPGGTARLTGFVFKTAAPPTISSFTPTTTGASETVAITGTNFTQVTKVSFGGTNAASFVVNSATSITAVVNNGSSGDVTVTASGGTASLGGYTYKPVASTITSFTPTTAGKGETVTITGTNFTTVTNVKVGGANAASFTVLSPTSITAVVGSSSSGTVSVTSAGGTASLGGFVFKPALTVPAITSFTPTSAGYLETVIITGTNFTGATAVRFGGTDAASFGVNSATSITALVARGASGDVTVTTPGGTASLGGFVFKFPPPTISSFAPTTASPAETVKIFGTNFTDVTNVKFGGVDATSFTVLSANTINAIVGNGASGEVTVITKAGTVRLAGFVFKYGVPTITSFTPTSTGPLETVTITGTNFTGVTAVRFGGTDAVSFGLNSATGITAVVARGASGDVTVTTPGGTASLGGYVYKPVVPTITSFTPTTAGLADSVRIIGTDFTQVTNVKFGGVDATSFSVLSPTIISAKVGSGASGEVTVTTNGGTTRLAGFIYKSEAPAITSFTPNTGTQSNGVTITGKNFTGATSVTFGGVKASFSVGSSTTIYAALGNGASGDVVVTTPAGTASLGGFVYVSSPLITSFTPTSAKTGDVVTLKGRGFTDVNQVVFGNVNAASFSVLADTVITAVVGTGATGKIQVSTSLSSSTAGLFTYVTGPVITSFSPLAGGKGSTVVIKGLSMDGTTTVTFGGVPAQSFTIRSATEISAVVGDGATGDVGITTPAGKSALSGFYFVPVPVIKADGTTTFAEGGKVILSTTRLTQALYQWFRNDVALPGATDITYVATESGSYYIKATVGTYTVASNAIVVKSIFTLPANNFKVSAQNLTCKGAKNGSVSIEALAAYNYQADITGPPGGNINPFLNNKFSAIDLQAGTYNVCITIPSKPDYQQCFTVVIDEPKDLSVYVAVNRTLNTITLNLNGSDTYEVHLNDKVYHTTDNSLTIPLTDGSNKLAVNTSKLCQGIFQQVINITGNHAPYPNPFVDYLDINIGEAIVKAANIEIFDVSNGRKVFSRAYKSQSGIVRLDLNNFGTGVYSVHLTLDNKQSVYKIIKK